MTLTTPVPTPFTTRQRMSWLVHGYSKKGKSTVAATCPRPVLVLDAEGSWRFIPGRTIEWDPLREPPPLNPGGACQHPLKDANGVDLPHVDGCWDICVVYVAEWQTVQTVYTYLTQWAHVLKFVSVVIDSITELQRRCKANLKGTEAMKIQDWGVLLSVMDATIRGFRDLCLMPQLSVRCVVFVSETRETGMGRLVPYMQGQIAVSLPYWVDVCGYIYVDYEKDQDGQFTQEVRRLWIGPHTQYESGERVQGRLGNVLTVSKPPEGQTGQEIAFWMCHAFRIPWEQYLATTNGHQATGVSA
jgi:hypothetical protein